VQIYTPPEKLLVPTYLFKSPPRQRMKKGFSCTWPNTNTGSAFISTKFLVKNRTGETLPPEKGEELLPGSLLPYLYNRIPVLHEQTKSSNLALFDSSH